MAYGQIRDATPKPEESRIPIPSDSPSARVAAGGLPWYLLPVLTGTGTELAYGTHQVPGT
jgi:hypothetical protein